MPRAKKPPLSFAEKLAKSQERYGTYDPETEGYGTPKDWRRNFEQTIFGTEELARLLGQDNPIHILGFATLPTFDELRKAFRKLMMENHPDHGGSDDAAKRIIAAYQTLKARYQ